MKSKPAFQEMLFIAAILCLAACLRVYRLDELPPGLHYDEAFNAQMATRVLTGVERPIFFRENLTEEPMAIYTAAIFFGWFGESAWTLRLASAFAGIVGVATLYALARAMFASRRVAALAALVLALLYWHINFSRLGMELIFAPLMMTLCVLFLWKTVASRQSSVASHLSPFLSLVTHHLSPVLAGIFLAATQYTYKAAIIFPAFVAAWIGAEIFADKSFLARHRRGLWIGAGAAFLAFLPLGLYFVTHPGEFLERPTSISIASAGFAALGENTLKIVGMFFWRGDANPRSNLPERPALDAFLALGFIIGLLACLAQWRRREARALLLWFGVMLLPSALTDYAPHFGRSIGATPAVALIVAFGIKEIIEKAESKKQKAIWLLPTVYGLLISGFAFTAYSTARDYFAVWGARAGLFDSFDAGILRVGQQLAAQPPDERIYFSPLTDEHYTMRFGLRGRAATGFDSRRALVLAPPGERATYGIITRDDPRALARLQKIYPAGARGETLSDFNAQPYAAIFRTTEPPQIAPHYRADARLDDAIELLGYDLARDGAQIALTIYWRSLNETRSDYTAFAHLLGAINPATGSPVWAQDDHKPGGGTYTTPRWRAGEIVIDEYRLTLPRDLPRGAYEIEMGLYVLETGARARVTDTRGARMENDRVLSIQLSLP